MTRLRLSKAWRQVEVGDGGVGFACARVGSRRIHTCIHRTIDGERISTAMAMKYS
jgi:hypothetical protein